MNDVLIGAADLYNWAQIKPWAQSARESGFEGDIWLITYRVDPDVHAKAADYNVNICQVEHDPYGLPIKHTGVNTPTQAHNLRFYHAWELLTRLHKAGIRYRYVIMTDVSDVVFQIDPVEELVQLLPTNKFDEADDHSIVVSSEGLTYSNEEWGKDNMTNGFGQLRFDLMAKDWTIFNVGTIAGFSYVMTGLFNVIFSMTEGRYYPSDQSSFNIILRHFMSGMWAGTTHEDTWACQLGTTMDPTKSWLWGRLDESRPHIRSDGIVVNKNGNAYAIVHQWNRVPELKRLYGERFA